jgi:hypothetical protein
VKSYPVRSSSTSEDQTVTVYEELTDVVSLVGDSAVVRGIKELDVIGARGRSVVVSNADRRGRVQVALFCSFSLVTAGA